MKNTRKKLILISFILALLAAITVFLYLKSLKSPDETIKKTTILVAAETIPSRALIEKKMIKEVQISDNSIFSDYVKDYSKIVGKYSKDTIFKDEGFRTDKLLERDGNELSLKIDSNHRAISISVTGDTGVSNLLKPKDYVDVIAYIAEKKDGAVVVSPDVAKVILQNIELLAVDKQLSREDKSNDSTNDKEKTSTNFLVTLSVPTLDVEKLVLAQSIGKIKLVLRPLKDDNTTETKGTTLEQLSINVNNNTKIVSTQENSSGNITSESNNNQKYINYTVKRKDNLKTISMQFYGDKNKYTLIKQANNIQNENLIFAGQIIKIPVLQ